MASISQHTSPSFMACSPESIPYPNIFGAEITSLIANTVSDLSAYVHEGYYINHGSLNVQNVSFCNVTVTHTHPGYNDTVNTEVWLPIDTWNGRMQGIGGSGFAAGVYPGWYALNQSTPQYAMIGAVGEGYAAVTTDAGHTSSNLGDWLLKSPGNIDLALLNNLGSVSLNDAALIGKDVISSFYSQPPKFSYFSGCSQGGRQGLTLAQRYPTAYDGIVASAPAIHLTEFMAADYWPSFVMNTLGEYIYPCELKEITKAAIKACDANDGVLDGLITDPTSCKFNPYTLVGNPVDCPDAGKSIKISMAAATVANASWEGARSSTDSQLWFGINHEAPLTGTNSLSDTECSANGTCVSVPFTFASDWIRFGVKKNASFNPANITHEEYDAIFRASAREYASLVNSDGPDLSEFRRAGGKMLTFQGLADSVIPPTQIEQYYEDVAYMDSHVHDFYRLFESPGLMHCYGGAGAYPSGIFDSMVDWVESGLAPDFLNATVPASSSSSKAKQRLLCPYPQRAVYDGVGDTSVASSFKCV